MTPVLPILAAEVSALQDWVILLIIAAVVVVFILIIGIFKRYKVCPSNRVLVVYGKTGGKRVSKTVHGGAAFLWPIFQDYEWLSLEPMQIEIPLKGALSIENIRVNVPSVFTVAVGAEEAAMQNAAIRLLGLSTPEVMKQAEDIIFGQLRQVIASMGIEDINRDRDKFLVEIQESLEPELEKIGLVLINVNITDITDESGYIDAIGKKAASEAINQAEIDVAQQEKKGAIGVAEADREKAISVSVARKEQQIGTKEAERDQEVRVAELDREKIVGQRRAEFGREAEVAQAEQDKRVRIADANAKAVVGENEAAAEIAATNADLRIKEADAYERAETRHREAEASVQEAGYLAQAKAAKALAEKIEQEQRAELEARAKAEKARIIVDAEAEAEQVKIDAQAQAEAMFVKLEAEARGEYEILAKKGQGLGEIIKAAGGPQEAFQLLMLEHMDHLSETAADAIANIKFDKVVVWDPGKEGSGVSGFLKNLTGALPPMLQMMRDVGGVKMPEYFGKLTNAEDADDAEEDDTILGDDDSEDDAKNQTKKKPTTKKKGKK